MKSTLLRAFHRATHSAPPEFTISSPHNEKGAPQPQLNCEAKQAMRSFVPNSHAFLDKTITVPGTGKSGVAVQAEREPFCSMDSLKFAPRHLAKMADLCKTCAPEHRGTLNRALDGIFMIAAASESITAFRSSQGNPSWQKLDLSSEHAVSALQETICAQYFDFKKSYGVNLESLSYYPHQAQEAALSYVSHLAVAIAYDQGAKVSAATVGAQLHVKWSPQSADTTLIEAFAPAIHPNAKANWMATLDILVHAARYAAPGSTRPQPEGSRPAPDASGHRPPGNERRSNEQPHTSAGSHRTAPQAEAQRAESSQTEYQSALAEAQAIVAQIIGKTPPEPGTTPKCQEGYGGMLHGVGNLMDFFKMSSTDKSAAAESDVKRQYRAILRVIHPDKHADRSYEELAAFVEMTKLYTSANDEANKWFGSRGA